MRNAQLVNDNSNLLKKLRVNSEAEMNLRMMKESKE
jgi:hypothetical protein